MGAPETVLVTLAMPLSDAVLLWRWRDAVVWRTAVPHGKSAIGSLSLFYSSNGEDVSFPMVMGLTLPVREHKNNDGSYGSQKIRTRG